MGVTSCATLPFPPETHVFSTVFKLLQANSTLFKHLWLVTVSVSLPPDYPLVKADFSLMEQVLVNLLLNACVHTPEGTSVTLQGGADSVRGQVWLDIHDMGPGIPPERAETIFERFRTTRPGGLGLGLPIVRGFMEAQRGAVSLVPVSAGTFFRIVLPLVEHDSVPEE